MSFVQSSPSPFQESTEEVLLQLTVRLGHLREMGGFADLYDGTLLETQAGFNSMKKVAVKRFRVYRIDASTEKMIARGLRIWRICNHENILRLLGITVIDGLPCTISNWIENGPMNKYLERVVDANVLEILKGVASGLAYLHGLDIIHGDLKGSSVLISGDGRAILSSFDVSRLWVNDITITGTNALKGSWRWMAPELISNDFLQTDHEFHTKASDVWAFGMVIYEALSRRVPYYESRNDVPVLFQIINGELPTKPDGESINEDLHGLLWTYCCDCWRVDPPSRPTAARMKSRLLDLNDSHSPSRATHVAELSTNHSPNASQIGQNILRRLVYHQMCFIPSRDVSVGSFRGSGMSADVYEGQLVNQARSGSTKVAVKRFKVILGEEEHFAKTFARELLIWEKIRHENILPLLGVTLFDDCPCMISEWMENGTMNAYLKMRDVDADILELVHGIACGLAYLHSFEVIHADLKGNNILISAEGRPLLADFGSSRLWVDNVTVSGTNNFKWTTRWAAPELLKEPDGDDESTHQFHTKETDVWAFGMVIYEALSKNHPFHQYQQRREGRIIMAIMAGELPTKPEEASDIPNFELMWDCCNRCWAMAPATRPTMSTLKEALDAASMNSETLSERNV